MSLLDPALTGSPAPAGDSIEDQEIEDAEFEEDESEEESDELDELEDEDEDEDDEDAEGDEDDDEEPELFTVTVDGTNEQVTLEDLKRDYSGQKYVQKRMEEAANVRKALEAEYQKFQGQQAQFFALVQQVQEQGGIIAAPTPPKREEYENDPYGFMQARMTYEADKEAFDKQQASIGQQYQQNQAQTAEQRQALLKEQYGQLVKKDADFGDPKKATEIKQKLVAKGQEYYEIMPEEMGQLIDHRAFQVLKDAIAYREMKEGKTTAKRKVKTKRRTVRAGAKKSDTTKVQKTRQRQRDRLRKTGSTRDAAALLLKPN